MAAGRIPVYMLGDRPRTGQRRNTVQIPERVILEELFYLPRHGRAVDVAYVPKRSRTYFGAARPVRAPRILTLGRLNDPSEGLRRTLVARTRYLQDVARRERGGTAVQ
jgi:hypothetical protein